MPDKAQWTTLRTELARQSGAVIFVGGSNMADGNLMPAEGVLEEYALAKTSGAFLLPIAPPAARPIDIKSSQDYCATSPTLGGSLNREDYRPWVYGPAGHALS
ncbi:hypothetical protein [Mesorhizobium sp.]|uniref:hypothetical protein n=1 Tax=Mesorhizobium sp. TaxID=1871066 RepID=UPI002580AED4|nr:hypothetical protein [Mesorhizobium sp.]